MSLMRREEYPPQAERNEQSAAYQVQADAMAKGVDGDDIAYGHDVYQRIALFRAPKPNGTILAFMHGGRWSYGYKENAAFMAPALNAAGVTLASIGHRLAPRGRFPDPYNDIADGIAWIARHAKEFGGDAGRIFVSGHSSGGHLASIIAVRHDWQAVRGLLAGVVRGALPISGVYDITDAGWGNRDGRCPTLRDDDDGRAASPLHTFDRSASPHLVTWGSDDYPFLIPQAKDYAAALKKAGVETETLEVSGKTHFTIHLEAAAAGGEWMKHAVAFMEKH